MYIKTWLMLCFCCWVACSSEAPENKVKMISASEAIQIAEKYVAEQGYTKQEIDGSKTTIRFEEGEYASDTTDIVKMRHNTLEAEAAGARAYGPDNKSWVVGFNYINPENNIVRGIIMDSLGRNVQVKQDVRFDWIRGRE